MESNDQQHGVLAGAAGVWAWPRRRYSSVRRIGRRRRKRGRRAPDATDRGARTTLLQATPIDVSELLHELVFETDSHGGADLGHADGAGRIRAHAAAAGTGRSGTGGARAGGAIAFPLRRAGAALPAAGDAGPARAGVSRSRGAVHPQRVLEITRGRAFCLFTSYSQMRDLVRAAAAGARFSRSCCTGRRRARRCSRSFAPRRMRCCSGRRASGRAWTCRASAELRDHRPAAVCRAQRPGGAGAHEGD